jgi:hypothetical protein
VKKFLKIFSGNDPSRSKNNARLKVKLKPKPRLRLKFRLKPKPKVTSKHKLTPKPFGVKTCGESEFDIFEN